MLSCGWVLSQVVVTVAALDWLLFALSTLPLPPATLQSIVAFLHHAHSLVSIERHEHSREGEGGEGGEVGGGHPPSSPPTFTWASLASILPPPASLLLPLPALLSPLPSPSPSVPKRLPRLPPSSSSHPTPHSRSRHPTDPPAPLPPLTSALLLEYGRLLRYKYPSRGLHTDHLHHLLHLAVYRMKGTTREGGGAGGGNGGTGPDSMGVGEGDMEGAEAYVAELKRGGGGGETVVSAGVWVVVMTFLFLFPSLTFPTPPSLPFLLACVATVFAAVHPVGEGEREELRARREREEEEGWERDRRRAADAKEHQRRTAEKDRMRAREAERRARELYLIARHPDAARLSEMAKMGVDVPRIPMLPWPGARRVHGMRREEGEEEEGVGVEGKERGRSGDGRERQRAGGR